MKVITLEVVSFGFFSLKVVCFEDKTLLHLSTLKWNLSRKFKYYEIFISQKHFRTYGQYIVCFSQRFNQFRQNYEQFLRSCHFCWWTYTIFIKEVLINVRVSPKRTISTKVLLYMSRDFYVIWMKINDANDMMFFWLLTLAIKKAGSMFKHF